MKIRLGPESADAERLIPPASPDGSGIGVNYVDAYLKAIAGGLPDGRQVSSKRKGLKVTLQVGEAKGEALLRRLDHGPDPRRILRAALEEAASAAGLRFSVEDGAIHLEVIS